MSNSILVSPNKIYEDSFKRYVLAYKLSNEKHYFNKYRGALDSFDKYLSTLKTLLNGNFPVSVFWLINNNEVVGVLRLRHVIDPFSGNIGYDISPEYRGRGFGFEILKLGLLEAKKIGLKKVTLTCDINNVYSKKIIQSNGGVFIEAFSNPEDNKDYYRFEIVFRDL